MLFFLSCSLSIITIQGVLDRFSQIKPKVIFSVEAVCYNGRTHDHLTKLRNVVDGLPDVCKVVIQPFCGSKDTVNISSIPKRFVGEC